MRTRKRPPNYKYFHLLPLFLRVGFGGAMLLLYGYSTIIYLFNGPLQEKANFPNLFHVGGGISFVMVLLLQVFCPIFIIFGLKTRIASIVSIFILVISLVLDLPDDFLIHESILLFLIAFFVLAFFGGGAYALTKSKCG